MLASTDTKRRRGTLADSVSGRAFNVCFYFLAVTPLTFSEYASCTIPNVGRLQSNYAFSTTDSETPCLSLRTKANTESTSPGKVLTNPSIVASFALTAFVCVRPQRFSWSLFPFFGRNPSFLVRHRISRAIQSLGCLSMWLAVSPSGEANHQVG